MCGLADRWSPCRPPYRRLPPAMKLCRIEAPMGSGTVRLVGAGDLAGGGHVARPTLGMPCDAPDIGGGQRRGVSHSRFPTARRRGTPQAASIIVRQASGAGALTRSLDHVGGGLAGGEKSGLGAPAGGGLALEKVGIADWLAMAPPRRLNSSRHAMRWKETGSITCAIRWTISAVMASLRTDRPRPCGRGGCARSSGAGAGRAAADPNQLGCLTLSDLPGQPSCADMPDFCRRQCNRSCQCAQVQAPLRTKCGTRRMSGTCCRSQWLGQAAATTPPRGCRERGTKQRCDPSSVHSMRGEIRPLRRLLTTCCT